MLYMTIAVSLGVHLRALKGGKHHSQIHILPNDDETPFGSKFNCPSSSVYIIYMCAKCGREHMERNGGSAGRRTLMNVVWNAYIRIR